MKAFVIGIVIVLLLAGTFGGAAELPDERSEIIDVVHEFFKVIETHSETIAKKICVAEGLMLSIREQEKGTLVKHESLREFTASLKDWHGTHKETITNPKVLVHKKLAVVWAEYKFYIDGKFTHCGVDSFTLIKTETGWKIASLVYTVEKTGCK